MIAQIISFSVAISIHSNSCVVEEFAEPQIVIETSAVRFVEFRGLSSTWGRFVWGMNVECIDLEGRDSACL